MLWGSSPSVFSLNAVALVQSPHLDVLGLTFDAKLTLESNLTMRTVAMSASRMIFIIRRACRFFVVKPFFDGISTAI